MHANLELTNLCNQRCLYCFNDSGPFADRSSEFANWPGLIDALSRTGFASVHFTGGEPFVLKNVISLMRRALDRGLGTSVLSNGHDISKLIEGRDSAEVLSRLTVAQISLDSMDEDQHDARRGRPGAWRMAVSAIKSLRVHSVPTEISCVVDAGNERSVVDVVQFAIDQDAKVIIRPRMSSGRSTTTYSLPAWLSSALGAFGDRIVSDRFAYLPNESVPSITVMPNGRIRGREMQLGGARLETASQLMAAAWA